MKFRCLLGLFAVGAGAVYAQPPATADVVVIVDSSASMSRPGYDPERTALLVTKLFTDIVPGQLAVVRLLDAAKDIQWIPSKELPETVPCSDSPKETCRKIEPVGDWDNLVRSNKYGALVRPSRGDGGYKQALDGHLAQNINNSFSGLGFRAAQGVFDPHPPGAPRTVIWLSDGDVDDRNRMRSAVRELTEQHTAIEAIIFGKGSIEVADKLNLNPRLSRSPSELMKSFAAAFGRIVQAPYQIDNLVRTNPAFDMREKVVEVWIIAYGDDTLGDVTIDTPSGQQQATYARDMHRGAGAYRVYYGQKPAPGKWTVHAAGGGAAAAYAVIQRVALAPIFLEPRTAMGGVPVTIKAGVGPTGTAQVLSGPDLPAGIELDLTAENRNYPLNDEAKAGDQKAGDGIYSAVMTFENQQRTPVTLRMRSPFGEVTVVEDIQVIGVFHYKGGPITLDLGSLAAGGQSCRDIRLIPAEHTGAIPFELAVVNKLQGELTFEVRTPAGNLRARGSTVPVGPTDNLQVCILASDIAASSAANGERWLELRAAGSNQPDSRIPINLRWQVKGVSPLRRFVQQGRFLVAGVLGLVLVVVVAYGFVKPKKFQRNMALAFGGEYGELDGAAARPLTQFNVGPGWYSDAKAYIHPTFKVSKEPTGALASLSARGSYTEVRPAPGQSLFRETISEDWEPVPPAGRNARPGESYRIGNKGPFFKIVFKA